MSPAFSSSDGGIFRSDDVGKTWKRFDHGVKAEATMMGVAVHPRDPQQVVGVSKTGQVFTTGDGGDSWSGQRLRLTLVILALSHGNGRGIEGWNGLIGSHAAATASDHCAAASALKIRRVDREIRWR